MKKLLPGLILAVIVSVCAKVVSGYLPGPGTISLAIIIGIVVGNILPGKDRFSDGVNFGEKKILPVAIALMGLELEFHTLGKLGIAAFGVVIPAMVLSVFVAFYIGKKLGLTKSMSLVLGVGNSVCGSSAIIASAPVVKADKSEVGVSVSAVNLMGTVGIFLMPALAHMIALNDLESSYLIGGTLQAIGQVVASGFSVSDNVGDVATIVKMLRVLMIGPIVLILSFLYRGGKGEGGKKSYVPGYIWGFIGFAILGSFLRGDEMILPYLKTGGKLLLLVAMASVGLRIHFKALIKQGPKAIIVVTLLTIIQTLTVLGLMKTLL